MEFEEYTNVELFNSRPKFLNKRSKIELQKIKIFLIIQKNFATVGINSNLVTQDYPFNERILKGYLIICSWTISNVLYCFHGPESFSEYTQSIYVCSLCILISIAYTILILKVEKLFEFIDGVENVVNTSKY